MGAFFATSRLTGLSPHDFFGVALFATCCQLSSVRQLRCAGQGFTASMDRIKRHSQRRLFADSSSTVSC
jgi:hypothetical protein